MPLVDILIGKLITDCFCCKLQENWYLSIHQAYPFGFPMRVWFTKMSGAGNDFVVIDNRTKKIRNGPKAAKILCDRRWGIGADGLLLLEKSRRAEYKMMYFNADGSYGGMCGNGGRCIALYAALNGIAPREHEFEALDHVYTATVNGSVVDLVMKDPRALDLKRRITLSGKKADVNFVDTGSPHVVVLRGGSLGFKALEKINVVEIGAEIRFHPAFKPHGANANFVERAGRKSIRIRTYERGVEAETMACGTGSIASAIVASRLWKIKPPLNVIARSGKTLKISFDDDGKRITNVHLAGPAVISFFGIFDL